MGRGLALQSAQSLLGAFKNAIDLAQEYGSTTLPEAIYVAVGAYATADGGALVRSVQVPPSLNNDGNIDANEYLRIPLCSLLAGGCARPCAADFNQDGGVDGADVVAFFLAWESGDSAADVNEDGGVDGSDVGLFFRQWEQGGC